MYTTGLTEDAGGSDNDFVQVVLVERRCLNFFLLFDTEKFDASGQPPTNMQKIKVIKVTNYKQQVCFALASKPNGPL